MAKRQSIVTAATMTVDHVPKGTRPEEFLRDEDLVGLYQRQLDSLPATDSKARRRVQSQLSAARRAAAITASVDPDVDLSED
jgi:hypothetical protein